MRGFMRPSPAPASWALFHRGDATQYLNLRLAEKVGYLSLQRTDPRTKISL